MIEWAKFTYSPLRKAFEKQIKTIANQVKAIQEDGKQLLESNSIIKKYDYDTEKDSPGFLKPK